MCCQQVYIHAKRHLTQVKILDQSDSGTFSYKICPSYFFLYFYFFSREFCICVMDLLMCYQQVYIHTNRHLIQVKILDQIDLGAFP